MGQVPRPAEPGNIQEGYDSLTTKQAWPGQGNLAQAIINKINEGDKRMNINKTMTAIITNILPRPYSEGEEYVVWGIVNSEEVSVITESKPSEEYAKALLCYEKAELDVYRALANLREVETRLG